MTDRHAPGKPYFGDTGWKCSFWNPENGAYPSSNSVININCFQKNDHEAGPHFELLQQCSSSAEQAAGMVFLP